MKNRKKGKRSVFLRNHHARLRECALASAQANGNNYYISDKKSIAYFLIGKEMVNVVPCPTLLFTVIRPPSLVMIPQETYSPMPVP